MLLWEKGTRLLNMQNTELLVFLIITDQKCIVIAEIEMLLLNNKKCVAIADNIKL